MSTFALPSGPLTHREPGKNNDDDLNRVEKTCINGMLGSVCKHVHAALPLSSSSSSSSSSLSLYDNVHGTQTLTCRTAGATFPRNSTPISSTRFSTRYSHGTSIFAAVLPVFTAVKTSNSTYAPKVLEPLACFSSCTFSQTSTAL